MGKHRIAFLFTFALLAIGCNTPYQSAYLFRGGVDVDLSGTPHGGIGAVSYQFGYLEPNDFPDFTFQTVLFWVTMAVPDHPEYGMSRSRSSFLRFSPRLHLFGDFESKYHHELGAGLMTNLSPIGLASGNFETDGGMGDERIEYYYNPFGEIGAFFMWTWDWFPIDGIEVQIGYGYEYLAGSYGFVRFEILYLGTMEPF